jgi:hypothetical protein
LMAFTVALGITALLESLTVPDTLPPDAAHDPGMKIRQKAKRTKR